MPPEAFTKLPFRERVALTKQAREAGVPLVQRWRELDRTVSEEWRPRAELAAALLVDADSIADLGCGHMLLESCLRPGQGYFPVDFIARDSRTIIADFNSEALPELGATHFSALGLLEYVYRLEAFLCRLRESFAGGVATFFARGNVREDDRLANGWVNHQTEKEIRDLLQQSGFSIRCAVEWRPSHWMYRLD
jgi:hypothetical protein